MALVVLFLGVAVTAVAQDDDLLALTQEEDGSPTISGVTSKYGY